MTLIRQANSTCAATFSGSLGMVPSAPFNVSIPKKGFFVTWGQRGAILKDAPHPEGAKLLHNFFLTDEYQDAANTGMWSVRQDMPPPTGYPPLSEVNSTNPNKFDRFMADRPRIERLKLFYENLIGTPQRLSPLLDDL